MHLPCVVTSDFRKQVSNQVLSNRISVPLADSRQLDFKQWSTGMWLVLFFEELKNFDDKSSAICTTASGTAANNNNNNNSNSNSNSNNNNNNSNSSSSSSSNSSNSSNNSNNSSNSSNNNNNKLLSQYNQCNMLVLPVVW